MDTCPTDQRDAAINRLRRLLTEDRLPTIVLIDGVNTSESAQGLRARIDFEVLSDFFAEHTDLIHCTYYTALQPNQDKFVSLSRFLDRLDGMNRMKTVRRTMYPAPDAAGAARNASMAVEIATDLIATRVTMPLVRNVVLFSGRGELIYPVRLARDLGLRVLGIGGTSTVPRANGTSGLSVLKVRQELRNMCDAYISLEDFGSIVPRLIQSYGGASA